MLKNEHRHLHSDIKTAEKHIILKSVKTDSIPTQKYINKTIMYK